MSKSVIFGTVNCICAELQQRASQMCQPKNTNPGGQGFASGQMELCRDQI